MVKKGLKKIKSFVSLKDYVRHMVYNLIVKYTDI